MQDVKVTNDVNNETEITYSNDFYENDDQVYGNPNVESDVDVLRKRKIKSDVGSTIATFGINALPIIIDALKHRKDPTPYRINRSDAIRLGVAMVMPTVQMLDTVCNHGKLQAAIEEKTPFKMSDIRNVVNVVQAYPAVHRTLTNFMGNVSREANGKQKITESEHVKRDTYLGCATTIAPYIIDKFSDETMSFTEKVSSVIPIKMFGGLVRRFADSNPTARRLYDATTAIVNVASVGNREFNNLAVKSNHGQMRSTQNTLGSVIDVVQDLTGMSRGNIGGGYGDYYGRNGSRWGGGY